MMSSVSRIMDSLNRNASAELIDLYNRGYQRSQNYCMGEGPKAQIFNKSQKMDFFGKIVQF